MNLLLDTNIFIKLRGSKVGPQVEAILGRHTGARLFISDMTCFEIIRASNDLEDAEHAVQLLCSKAKRVPVDKDMLCYAAYYYNILCKYMKDGGLMKAIYPKHLSDSDTIIGATAIRMHCMICTTNGNDFPRPFFTEVSVDDLGIDQKERLFILQADTPFYDAQFKRLMKGTPPSH